MKYIAILITLLFPLTANAYQSTVNPILPVANTPLTSGPVRNNFQATYNDINNIYALLANGGGGGGGSGTVTSVSCSPTSPFTCSIDNPSTTPVIHIGGTFQGNGAKIQLSTGLTTNNNCVKFDANGNTVDAGSPCGTGGGSVSSVFGRVGTITAQSGDYSVAQITGAAPTASPTFTGTVTLPIGQIVNGVTLSSSGSSSLFLNQSGTYSSPPGSGGLTVGTTTITSGTTTRILFDNAGTLGEYIISGTGSVAMTGSPSFTGTVSGSAATWTSTDTALNFSATGNTADTLPSGTSAQRPGSPTNGMIRYNSSVPQVEAFYSGAWNALSTGGSVSVTSISPGLIVNPSPGTGTFTLQETDPIISRGSVTSYTIVASDMGNSLGFTSNSAVAVTLPQAGTTGFLTGTSIKIIYTGTNTLTITPTTSTILGVGSSITLTQGQSIYLISDGTNYWPFQGRASGTVTSIATTSPITGGTITNTGTIACATCVVASSPGSGIAHFAGSTQTVTSSAVALASDVSGTLPTANGGLGANESAATGVVQMSSGTTSVSTALASTTTATTQAIADSTTKVATTAFVNPASSIAGNGYTKLPNGVIMEWGPCPSGGGTTTFALPFPNTVFSIQVTSTNTVADTGSYVTINNSTFNCVLNGGISGDYFAIGN